MRSLPCLLGLMCVAALCSAANHRALDVHTQDGAAVLYQRSSFAHGYLHGYEDGFHAADQNLQLGHTANGIKSRLDAHDLAPRSRMPEGDPGLYAMGYRQGAEAGYADGIGEREFRAIRELRLAADGLDTATPAQHFDRGFADGYAAGRTQGARNEYTVSDFSYVGAYCRDHLRTAATPDSYCDAYTRGYRMGFNDGRTQQTAPQTARAGH